MFSFCFFFVTVFIETVGLHYRSKAYRRYDRMADRSPRKEKSMLVSNGVTEKQK